MNYPFRNRPKYLDLDFLISFLMSIIYKLLNYNWLALLSKSIGHFLQDNFSLYKCKLFNFESNFCRTGKTCIFLLFFELWHCCNVLENIYTQKLSQFQYLELNEFKY